MMQPQEYAVKGSSKYRGLGFAPINFYKEGTQFHHMFLNGDPDIGMFVPTKLHCGIAHDRFNKNGMREMNKAALLWLACQERIAPVVYSQDYTDYQFVGAVRKCLKKTTVTSAEVADELGCNRQFAKIRMKNIAEYGKLIQEFKNTSWGFKLPDEDKQFFEVKNESGELLTLCEEGKCCEVNGVKITIERAYDPEK